MSAREVMALCVCIGSMSLLIGGMVTARFHSDEKPLSPSTGRFTTTFVDVPLIISRADNVMFVLPDFVNKPALPPGIYHLVIDPGDLPKP